VAADSDELRALMQRWSIRDSATGTRKCQTYYPLLTAMHKAAVDFGFIDHCGVGKR